MSHSWSASARQAWCIATSEVEQAVCTFMLGPRRLSLYEIRVVRKSWPLANTRDRPDSDSGSGPRDCKCAR